ncbi:hypothetical protein [Winogradskyella sp. A3E31]|uniref:hypothetical protein n=1 Tax=Winogradskyella sp. A3E31 TaxID=3349637 RepID=UPI00398A5768
MKQLLAIVIVFFTYTSYGQDPILQEDNDTLEEIAFDLTQAYNKELGLTGKQVTLFQKKVEEYLIREERIHQSLTGKTKLNRLHALRTLETKEMGDILTQPQLTLYKKLKPKLQPLAVVEDPDNR